MTNFSLVLPFLWAILTLVGLYLLFKKLFSWVAKQLVRCGTSFGCYLTCAVTAMLLPLSMIVVSVVWNALDATRRKCGLALTDSPSHACGWGDYVTEQLLLGFIVFSVPMFVWMVAGGHAFYVVWRNNHPATPMITQGKNAEESDDLSEGSKRG